MMHRWKLLFLVTMEELIAKVEGYIHQGRYIEARARAEEGLKAQPHLRLQQLLALAMSKSGVPEEAREFLEPIYKTQAEDPETAGILASIYKELFRKHQDTTFAMLSRDTYLKNFDATKSYYTGINAASMSAIVMQASKSKKIARDVVSLIDGNTEDFWELATLGEAYLLLKEKEQSLRCFAKARKVGASDWGKITSVHNQLWLLNHFIPVSGEVQNLFSPPSVVAFIGHMIDHPHSKNTRFPPSIEKNVKDAIANSLRTLNAKVGYCSLACGSDILFAEALAEQNGEVNIFVPFALEDFLNVSVRFAGDEWVDRFQALTSRFRITMLTKEDYLGYNDLFTLQSKIIFGASMIRSAQYHTQPHLLTVLSGVDLKRAEGGTRDTLRFWPTSFNHVNINPDLFLPTHSVAEVIPSQQPPLPTINRPVLYLILAEASHLNSLQQDKINQLLKQRVEEEPDSYSSLEIGENILVACNTETTMIETVKLLKGFLQTAQGLKITLHAGPALREGDTVKGETIEILKALCTYSPRGAISASGHVAALLALDTQNFLIEYSGIFTHHETRHFVFRIEWK